MTDILTEANNIISSEMPTVTVHKAYLDILEDGGKLLGALKAAGVEEWEGFEKAIGLLHD